MNIYLFIAVISKWYTNIDWYRNEMPVLTDIEIFHFNDQTEMASGTELTFLIIIVSPN